MWIQNVLFVCIFLHANVTFMVESTLLSPTLTLQNLQALKKETEANIRKNTLLANKIDDEFEQLLGRPGRRKRPHGPNPAQDVSKLRNEIFNDKDESTLHISDEQRQAASSMMSDLTRAVSHNSYATKNKRGSQPEPVLVSSKDFGQNSHSQFVREKQPENQTENSNDSEPSVNVLDSSFDKTEEQSQPRTIRHNRLNNRMAAHREVLEIVSINDNDNFEFGEEIIEWKNLAKKIDGKHALIGRTLQEIVLITESDGKYQLMTTIPLKTDILSLEVFPKYDENTKNIFGVVIAATKGKLTWFKVTSKELTQIWEWPLQKNIVLIRYFEFNKVDSLLVVSMPSIPNGPTSADIYEFDFHLRDFWIVQVISLNFTCTDVSILDTGYEYLICFPQGDQTDVYSYQQDAHERGRFALQTTIKSHNVTNLAGFKIGGFSYLAIGGYHPQILRYNRGRLRPQTILSQTFGLVEYWLPIPARTYRDDLILIVQHRLDFGSHFVSVLEALIWNGEAFETSLSVPCHIKIELADFGITCMTDFRREAGIAGSTIIQRGKNISLLVPRHEAQSGLFDIKFQLTSTADPIREEIEHLQKVYETFQEIIEQQDLIVLEAVDAILNGLNVDGDNVVTGNWNFESLIVANVEQTENTKWEKDSINFGGQPWNLQDMEIHLPAIEETLAEDGAKLVQLEEKSKKLVLTDSEVINIPTSLRVNGKIKIQGQLTADELTVETFDNEGADTVLENIRKTRDIQIPGSLSIKTLDVNKLVVDSINETSSSDLVFITSKNVTFNDILVIRKPVIVDSVTLKNRGKVNDVDLSEDLIVINSSSVDPSFLVFDHVQVVDDVVASTSINGFDLNLTKIQKVVDVAPDLSKILTKHLEITENLEVLTINGVNWSDVVNSIVIRKLPNVLEELEVLGTVNAEYDIKVENLNHLQLPNQFMRMTGPRQSKIVGKKTFKNVLRASQIDCDGTIDGIDPFNIVTLSTSQRIPGETKFVQIQVSESLEVNGTIKGKHLDEFLSNPNLLVTNVVESACTFRELHVEGPIYVENLMNDFDLDSVLTDVVYKSDSSAVINSIKTFGRASFDAEITTESKSVNDYKITDFLTSNTFQEVHLDSLVGNVLFKNLELTGSFDGVNVTDLDQTSIKLSGDQFTAAEIEVNEIIAKNLLIVKTLNDYVSNDFLNFEEAIHIIGDVHIDKLLVDQLLHTGDILGYAEVNDVNLTHFDLYRLSATRSQHIQQQLMVGTGEVSEKFHSQLLNGIEVKDFQSHAVQAENVIHQMSTGHAPVENMYISGSVLISVLNDQNMTNLLASVVWLNRPNVIYGTSKFLDTVTIDKTFNLTGTLNNQIFDSFVNDLVLKTEENPVVFGVKTFSRPVHLKGSLNTTKVNDILVKNVVLKTTKTISNCLHIYGNLIVDNVTVSGSLNDVPGQTFDEAYYYDLENKIHILKSNTIFDTYLNIGDFHVLGALNEIPDVEAYFQNIAQKNQPLNLTSTKRFLNEVTFETGVNIDNLNGVEIGNIAEDLVFIDDSDEVWVKGDVIFKSVVSAKTVHVNDDVFTNNLMGCNPDEWLMNGALINEPSPLILPPIYFPAHTFSASEISVGFVNNKPIDELLTLHTDQYFNNTFTCNELTTNGIQIGGTVNGYDLKVERENTLMVDGDQEIELPTSFQSVRILNSLDISGNVNERDFGEPALLDSDIHLESPISFKHLKVDSMSTKDLLSSIDFEHWYETALWKQGRDYQTIYGNWSLHQVTTKSEISGLPVINGYGIDVVMSNVEKSREVLDITKKKHREQYSNLCRAVETLTEKAKNSVYFLKYFEYAFTVPQLDKIVSVFSFVDELKTHYLVVNVGCTSGIYVWLPGKSVFKHILQEDTGYVSKWIQVTNKAYGTYLVTLSNNHLSECLVHGLNVWKFEEAALKLHRHFDNSSEVVAVQDNALNEKTFFVLQSDDQVHEYDVDGIEKDQWPLGTSQVHSFRFVPTESQNNVALADGKTVYLLSAVTNSSILPENKRRKRSLNGPILVAPPLKTRESPSFLKRIMDTMVNSIAAVESLNFPYDLTKESNDVTTRSLLVKPELYVGQPKDVEKFLQTQTLKPRISESVEKMDLSSERHYYDVVPERQTDSKRSNFKLTETSGESNVHPMHFDLLNSYSYDDYSVSTSTYKSTSETEQTSAKITTTMSTTTTPVTTTKTTTTMATTTTSAATTSTTRPTTHINLFSPEMTIPLFSAETTTTQSRKQRISKGRIQSESNRYIPENGKGEILGLKVGVKGNQRTLVAVSETRENTVAGNNDVIQIYEDVMEGKLYQTLTCNHPSALTTINVKDETVLAFLEGCIGVQIYIYRGIQGFVPFVSFKLATSATHMTAISLPPVKAYKCPINYLAVVTEFNVVFYEAITCGDCVDVQLNCDIY